ncbi:MAG: nitroreductase family protein [Bacteroidaceae bacterium]|nr:nitroreductase family protein [Bacteroidaceae bacterium]
MHYLKNAIKLFSYFFSDYIFYLRHNIDSKCGKDCQSAKIMLLMHQLEKGMSFTESKREFGAEKSQQLVAEIRKYIERYGINDVCRVAINVLNEFLSKENSTRNEDIRTHIEMLCKEYAYVIKSDFAGVKLVSTPPIFNYEAIEDFFASRSSVREFSDKPITDKELEAAIQIASYTPTACNRQTARLYHFNTKPMIKKMVDNQLGPQGWCYNATSCFVITVNQCYFGGGYERHQALIDGGLYAMNFVWGLHLNHIATCFKMFVREPKREKEFKRIANIPKNEIPVVLVLAGHYKSTPVISPKSVRINFVSSAI